MDYWYNKEEIYNYGLNDHIEENGSNLTLAQKSLIGVTKFLLKKNCNCNIIILDDLGLDDSTQEIVYKAIYSTFPNSTKIILTHEIKPYMDIDKVMVINKGTVAEFDTVDNLSKNINSLFNLLQNNYGDTN